MQGPKGFFCPLFYQFLFFCVEMAAAGVDMRLAWADVVFLMSDVSVRRSQAEISAVLIMNLRCGEKSFLHSELFKTFSGSLKITGGKLCNVELQG